MQQPRSTRRPTTGRACVQLEATKLEMKIFFRIGALRALWGSSRLAWRLMGDRRTPLGARLLLGLAVALIVSPINWIPSAIPILGQMEDLALLALALKLFFKYVPAELRLEHQAALSRT